MAGTPAPDQRFRWRFWAEAVLCAVAAALFVVTEIWPDWIERVFGVDPDHNDGGLEWAVLIALILIASTAFALARRELRRAEEGPPPVAAPDGLDDRSEIGSS